MANIYPPSPALSACDSLADIEDLDAFLEAQGQLSHWPTPPPAEKKEDAGIIVEEYECGFDSDEDRLDDEADAELWRIAATFTDLASGNPDCGIYDLELVVNVLLRAHASPAGLALAFNILKAVLPLKAQQPQDFPLPDLAAVSALRLADAFMSERPPTSEFWAREVCKGMWTARRINATMLNFLACPELKMLTLSTQEAIDAALRELCDIAQGSVASPRAEGFPKWDEKESARQEPPVPLHLDIDAERTQWVNGTITPAETPVAENGPWLRLL